MKNFSGKTAVITGAASGIGYALAKRAVQLGMNVVMADIEATALEQALQSLDPNKNKLLAVVTDVSDAEQVQALATKTQDCFGGAHLVFNNAGVGGGGCLWELDLKDWEWVLGVNLWGVIHGVKSFTQQLIDNGEGHIINTASIAGLMSAPGTSSYTVSKHAVVSLSEVLSGELKNAGHNVGVSVLCPAFVNTNIYKYERNRPATASLQRSEAEEAEQQTVEEATGQFFATALSPDDVAQRVFEAIEKDEFYILTHPDGSKEQVKQRMTDIIEGRYPSVTGPEAFPMS